MKKKMNLMKFSAALAGVAVLAFGSAAQAWSAPIFCTKGYESTV